MLHLLHGLNLRCSTIHLFIHVWPAANLGPTLLAAAASANVQPLLSLQNGTGWQDNGTPACNWTGMTCDTAGTALVGIDLAGHNLAGELSHHTWPEDDSAF